MNIFEIVGRKSGAKFTLNEVCFVVSEYIKDRKGFEVKINLEKRLDRRDLFFSSRYQNQLKKLYDAFDIASEYYIKKDEK